jgi:transcription initiation factor IIF auxiliary subunit
MTKILNQIIFFSSIKIRIFFFSNTGNQNIFLEKKHNPPFKLNGRSLIKRKNTLSKNVASSSDHPIKQEYNRVRNKVKGAVNKMKKKFENDLYGNAKKNPKAIRSYITSKSKTREGIGDLDIDPDANPE